MTELERPTCHFLRLPKELRLRIYEHLLLPLPASLAECAPALGMVSCRENGSHVGSTCKASASVVRTLKCSDCRWRGKDVHTSIMAANKLIQEEAATILYENTQLVLRDGGTHCPDYQEREIHHVAGLPSYAAQHIKHLYVALNADVGCPIPWFVCIEDCINISQKLPNLKDVTIHMDVKGNDQFAIPTHVLSPMHVLADRLEFMFDVHITEAHIEDAEGWEEVIRSRCGYDELGEQMDSLAEDQKANVVEALRNEFRRHGKTLNIAK